MSQIKYQIKVTSEPSDNDEESPLVLIEKFTEGGKLQEYMTLTLKNLEEIKLQIDEIEKQNKNKPRPKYHRQNANKTSIELEMEQTIIEMGRLIEEQNDSSMWFDVTDCELQNLSNWSTLEEDIEQTINEFNQIQEANQEIPLHPWENRVENDSWDWWNDSFQTTEITSEQDFDRLSTIAHYDITEICTQDFMNSNANFP
ncbi:hypothetical protein AC249_AIPGENE28084, partial [Exaiptasia diaphana]